VVERKGNWWQARKEDGTIGIVPSNYVSILDVAFLTFARHLTDFLNNSLVCQLIGFKLNPTNSPLYRFFVFFA
jgi:hypothetical protein